MRALPDNAKNNCFEMPRSSISTNAATRKGRNEPCGSPAIEPGVVESSQGVLVPKPLLAQVGLEVEEEMSVEKGPIVIRKPRRTPRAAWAAAARRIAVAQDDALTWPEFGNDADRDLKW